MRTKLLLLLILFTSTTVFSQENWDLVWSLDKKPFLDEQVESEMGIVKAGFDTDKDGWGEFLCAWTDKERNFILMYEASADNTYDLVWYWEYPLAANTFAGIAVGDIDNNGKVDIITTMPTVVGDDSPERLWVFEWSGVVGENKYGKGELGAITPTKGWNFELDNGIDFRPYSLQIEDIDKDGKNELIVGVRSGDRGSEVWVVSATGNLFGFGNLKIEYSYQETFGGSLYSVTTGDLDKDGKQEIYALVWANMTLRIFECNGDGQYELTTSIDSVYVDGPDYGAVDGLRVADVNKDGVNELYYSATEDDNQIFIITDISDVSQITKADIKPFYKIPRQEEGKLRTMSIVDHDGDGKMNLMIAGERNGQIFDLEYKGSGSPSDSTSWELSVLFDIFEYSGFSPDSAITLTPRFFYGSPGGDMDNDGKSEYLFVNYSTDFTQWTGDKYVWIIESDVVTSVQNPNEVIPNKISLEQNYPNPFNPSTTIKYTIPNITSNTLLRVYDMLGKEVATLVNEVKQPGDYEIQFKGNGLSSGVYYYTLKVGDLRETRQMILLK